MVSRTVTFGVLAGFITLVYVGVVVGIGSLVGAGDEPNLGLQVVATSLVAVLFQPVRQRLQGWVNRLVLGRRATPYEVLAAFSRHGSIPESDQTSVVTIARLLYDGTGAVRAAVWLRVGDEFHAAAVHPAAPAMDPVAAANGSLPVLPGSLVVPVRHDGELLGALVVDKRRGEPLSVQDREVVTRLASGVGVVLRNARLTAELRARMREIEASRQRIVSAQDEARRRLERDLSNGAQRQLGTLRASLGTARHAAETVGATKTSQLLSQIVTDAESAHDTLGDLARGIYPPLLESDGLGAALEAQTAKAAIPVTVHAAGLGRYPRRVESAVYFCVLEALTNVAKYANATSAHVRLDEQQGSLRFTIEDDGAGFDPTEASHGSGLLGMTDRIDTVGGVVEVSSRSGHGTVVAGRVPLAETAVTV